MDTQTNTTTDTKIKNIMRLTCTNFSSSVSCDILKMSECKTSM